MYRVKKSVKEEVEAIDETSKDLALRYLDKAPRSARIHGQLASEFKKTAERKRNPGLKAALEKSGQKYQRKAWNREDGIKRAIKKVANEEVEIEEGKIHGMGAIYTSMMHHADTKGYSSHKQFTPADYDTVGKQHGISGQELAVLAGHKTAHQASTQFKKPVQKGHEMDRAKALAQRGMQSLSKEEVEAIEEKLAHMHEPSRPHIYVKPNHEPSRPNIHVKPNHEPQDDIERFSKPRPKGGYGPSPINRKYKPTEYNYAYKEEVEQIDEAIPKTGWKVNKQLTANMDAPKHKDNKAYTTSASAQHSAFIHRSHDDDKWHVQIGTSDGKNHYKAFDSYEKAKAHLHSKTGITEELENESFKPEVEKSFPASGVKTGSSAPKGTSTMPKDKNKAKGQPAGSIGEEMSPYVKATLAVMDEGKMDDYQDMLRAKKATASAYDKNFKPDTSHPHIQVVKGTQYGGQNQKDDEGDEKKPDDETKEKRGRGRPHGSKSGARQKGNGHEDGGIPVHNLHLPNRNK